MSGSLPPFPNGSTVTIGSFDGVHRGHVAVLREVVARARAARRAGVLVTFEPHPLDVVRPDAAPLHLTTRGERREILAQTDLDYVLVLRFDRRMAALAPDAFVREILVDRCEARELVIGHDYRFGRGRAGDVATLRHLGPELGFSVDVLPPVDLGGERISSTRIRRAVALGNLAEAARYLGRPYQMSARVGRGLGRGQLLGVPTINLADVSPRKLLPPDGVFAVWVEWRGGRLGGMMNQGARPTFGDEHRTIEAHLFGFDGNLYDEWVRVEWVERLRGVERFASAQQLVDQLQRDRARAETVLAAYQETPAA